MVAKAATLAREISVAIDIFKYLDDIEVLYECFHAEAFGCQALETGHCDHGERCFDI